jgi:hypothetical protein
MSPIKNNQQANTSINHAAGGKQVQFDVCARFIVTVKFVLFFSSIKDKEWWQGSISQIKNSSNCLMSLIINSKYLYLSKHRNS